MRLKVDINDADPTYVKEKVGTELYVHLQAVPAIVDFRRAAIERAHALHAAGDPADEWSAWRARLARPTAREMFAVEDLGGLLHVL